MAYSGKDIQEALNKHGYNLDVDGIVGTKTKAAIKDFQTKNNLKVDGIVGEQTWGALTKSQTTTPTATTPAKTELTAPTFNYAKSDAVTQAEAALQQHLDAKPGDFSYSLQAGWDDIMNQILNREKFTYDLNGDALYQQYKDQYTTQGKLASMDVMGQAAAMTGGYGNSYAQTAGQQAYQGYLQQLNDKVPELYQLALDKYNQEGQDLYNQYGLYADKYNQEYGEYRDNLSDYYTDLNYLTENARYMSETEYNQALQDFNIKYSSYRDAVADDQWKQSFDYTKERDSVADQQWKDTFDEGVRQFNATHSLNTAKSGLVSDGNGGYTAKDVDNTIKYADIPKDIREKLSGMKSNTDVERYLENLESSGVINHETALQLMSEFMDINEVYNENADGTKSISYSGMVKSANGWSVVDNGGVNWGWGVDNNAIVEAPNGEKIRLDDLVDKLVAEGISKSEAKSFVKTLQKNLNI